MFPCNLVVRLSAVCAWMFMWANANVLLAHSSIRIHIYAHIHIHLHTHRFVVYTHSVLHWSSLRGIVQSWFPSLPGLFIRLPVAATLFKAPQDFCPVSTLSHLSLILHLFSLRPRSLSLSFSSIFVSLSRLDLALASFSLALLLFLRPLRHLFRSSFSGNPMPDNKGDCMYYLACLSHACLRRRFPIYFRISPRATRRDPVARFRNAIRSNRNSPDLLSRSRDPGMHVCTARS